MDKDKVGINKTLIDVIDKVVIVAYKEDISLLEKFIKLNGFDLLTLRQEDSLNLLGKSPLYRCFLNHVEAWKVAASQAGPTLILEADFVPVNNFANLPFPFDCNGVNIGCAWLYSCGPRIYSVDKYGFIEGGAGACVAYIITPCGAKLLLKEFVEIITKGSLEGKKYFPFDTKIDGFFIKKGYKNFISFRNYGEHGGITNSSHRLKAHLNGWNMADVLWGKLAFMPIYARKSKYPNIRIAKERIQGRLLGVCRLFSGRLLRPKIFIKSRYRWKLLYFSVIRFLIWSL